MGLTAGLIAGGVAANIGSNIIGSRQAKKQNAAAMEAIRAQMERLDRIGIPDIEKQKIFLDKLAYLGSIDPELEKAIAQGPTAYEQVSVDPRLKEAQVNALQMLSQLGQTGLTAGEKADLSQLRREVAGQEEARQKAILNSLAQRGMLGSGSELATRLSSSQESADRASQESDRLASMAQQRMLQALTQSGSLAGNIREQDYGEQARLAQARDVINQFNINNQRDIQQRNVGMKNTVASDAQAARQRIAEANVGLSNQQQQYNKALLQQKFNNEITKATGMNTPATAMADVFSKQAENTAKSWSTIGAGLGQAGTGLAKLYSKGSSDDDDDKVFPSGKNNYGEGEA